jgi:Rieske Fe-S protein
MSDVENTRRGPSPVKTRRLVNRLLGLGLISSMTGFVGTALGYLRPAADHNASIMIRGLDGPIDPARIGENEGVVGRSVAGKVLLVRKNGELIGLQASCTHLGCTVAWNGATERVECPCHGARYDLSGQVLRGPARDPLPRLQLRTHQEGIQVVPTAT